MMHGDGDIFEFFFAGLVLSVSLFPKHDRGDITLPNRYQGVPYNRNSTTNINFKS